MVSGYHGSLPARPAGPPRSSRRLRPDARCQRPESVAVVSGYHGSLPEGPQGRPAAAAGCDPTPDARGPSSLTVDRWPWRLSHGSSNKDIWICTARIGNPKHMLILSRMTAGFAGGVFWCVKDTRWWRTRFFVSEKAVKT